MDIDDDEIEKLRQAALKTIGTNKTKHKLAHTARFHAGPPTRIKTKGNLIEIQPTELSSEVAAREGLTADDYIVEEFILDGSDVSINSSDCDEVIEEVIVSDAEDADDLTDEQVKEPDKELELTQSSSIAGQTRSRSRSRSRSASSPSNHHSSEDESDAVSIKSSYSLIMDDDGANTEFQSVEAKFLSKKVQKEKAAEKMPLNENTSTSSSRRRCSRSPLPFRSRTKPPRRSRSRERDIIGRSVPTRKSRSKSRSPARRRNHSPLASTSSRGIRRPYRANSGDRGQRRRRSRSRSSSPPPPNRNRSSQNNRRDRSRSPPTDSNKPKQRVGSHYGAVKPSTEEKPEKIEKTIKNNSIPKEELERLEKRRKKFQGESSAGVLTSHRQLIKIPSPSSERKSKVSKRSPLTSKKGSPAIETSTQKEKSHEALSKQSVELVSAADHDLEVAEREKSTDKETCIDERSPSTGNDQEDLRTRLIKKKLQKMQQSSSGGGGGSNGPMSSVVVVSLGSQRIFSQALKNSQLLDSPEASNSKGNSNNSKKRSKSPLESESKKRLKPKSEVTVGRSSGNSKRLGSSNRSGTSTSSSSKTSKSKSSTSSGTKRVVSLTYS